LPQQRLHPSEEPWKQLARVRTPLTLPGRLPDRPRPQSHERWQWPVSLHLLSLSPRVGRRVSPNPWLGAHGHHSARQASRGRGKPAHPTPLPASVAYRCLRTRADGGCWRTKTRTSSTFRTTSDDVITIGTSGSGCLHVYLQTTARRRRTEENSATKINDGFAAFSIALAPAKK
jgi:hypothetical protein